MNHVPHSFGTGTVATRLRLLTSSKKERDVPAPTGHSTDFRGLRARRGHDFRRDVFEAGPNFKIVTVPGDAMTGDDMGVSGKGDDAYGISSVPRS